MPGAVDIDTSRGPAGRRRRLADHLRRDAARRARRRRAARGRGHRRRGAGPAHAPAPGRRRDPRLRPPDPPRRRGGRRLAQRQPLGRNQRPDHRNAFYDLDAPVGRVCSAEVPMPYCPASGTGRPAAADRVIAAARQAVTPVAEFRMPSLGADMEHGRIIEWLVKPGDYVHRGDLVATVDTDKALMDVESFPDGVVAELLVEPGATSRSAPRWPGSPTPRPRSRHRSGHRSRHPPRSGHRSRHPPRSGTGPVIRRRAAPGPGRRRAAGPGDAPRRPSGAAPRTPAGRGSARIHGTGKGGAITRADVEHAAAARPSAGRVRSSPAGPEARRRTRRRAFRGQRQRSGGCRDRGGRAARRRQPAQAQLPVAGGPGDGRPEHARKPARPGPLPRGKTGPRRRRRRANRGSPRARRQPAPGHRRPDVTLEEDDPALLSEHHAGPAGRRRMDAVGQRAAAGDRPAGPRGAAAQGRGARGARTCRR